MQYVRLVSFSADDKTRSGVLDGATDGQPCVRSAPSAF
jgi:hypothetical protein